MAIIADKDATIPDATLVPSADGRPAIGNQATCERPDGAVAATADGRSSARFPEFVIRRANLLHELWKPRCTKSEARFILCEALNKRLSFAYRALAMSASAWLRNVHSLRLLVVSGLFVRGQAGTVRSPLWNIKPVQRITKLHRRATTIHWTQTVHTMSMLRTCAAFHGYTARPMFQPVYWRPEVRFILRLARERTSDSKDTGKPMVLVWFGSEIRLKNVLQE